MTMRNTRYQWGWLNIVLHWLMAIMIFSLYALGWYMVDLDYYDPWYQSGPFWHKSFGLLFVLFILIRVINRAASDHPEPLPTHKRWEIALASFTHLVLYLLMLFAVTSGYFISTADGDGISFFGFFDVPAVFDEIDDEDDLAGIIHVYATDALLVLAGVHALAAIKHHVFDRDATLLRMLGIKKQ